MNIDWEKEGSSFRDLSGFVFKKGNVLYRQINFSYKENYEKLMNSGLYDYLVEENKLIEHKEIKLLTDDVYKIIKPNFIKYISYPYEWSFSMLKDASLLTLEIQKIALKYDMSLKDASAYNIQFTENCEPIFIDTLSFEKFNNIPWIAYGQFCRHFLAPLLLMTFVDMRCQNLIKSCIDGIPLDLVVKLLPFKTKFNPSIFMHIFLHSKNISKFESVKSLEVIKIKMSKSQHIAIIDNLIDLITSLKSPLKISEWSEYYDNTNYSEKSFLSKKEIVTDFIDKISPNSVYDLGANDGTFTRLASTKNIRSIAFDNDFIAVEKNYLQVKKNKEKNILPLLLDLANPSPSIGFANKERWSFSNRAKVDLTLMLALIHHLYFSCNLSFEKIASFVSEFTDFLVIEFVPKSDEQVQKIINIKNLAYEIYTIENFENEFLRHFDILEKVSIENSDRILYLMKLKGYQ